MSSKEEKDTVKVSVPSEEKKQAKKKNAKEEAGPSEEDLRIQAEVELLVTRVGDANPAIATTALESLATTLRTHTGTVASIPKPLKYVRKMFSQLETTVQAMQHEDNRRKLRDIMSFIAMTIDAKNLQESSLQHKLQGNRDDLASWGHEYLRFLAGELAKEWDKRKEAGQQSDELEPFIAGIVKFMLHHQDESTALDLLMEVSNVAAISEFVDDANLNRIAAYLVAIGSYLTAPADKEVLHVAFNLYTTHGAYSHALRVALILRDRALIEELFSKCDNPAVKVQMAFVCARARVFLDFDDETLSDINSNRKLVELFRFAAKELDSLTPKSPDEIFKTQLDNRTASATSHMHNLASLMVSGMANCGFGKDTMLVQEGTTCLYQTKDHRMMSATAALGLIHLWDEGEGLGAVDKYTYADENFIKAGAYLATGLSMCGVRSAFDAAYGLLCDHVSNANRDVRIGAILGLGYAYAGQEKSDVKELFMPILADSSQPLEVQCFAAYAAALVFPGTADEDLVETCISCIMEKEESVLLDPCVRLMILAVGVLFLGRLDKADALVDATQALSPIIRQYTEVVVRSCAYAGSGNVLEAQRMFHLIAENDDEDDEKKPTATQSSAADTNANSNGTGDSTAENEESAVPAPSTSEKPKVLNHKAAAVLGIALIALGENLGTEMAKRSLIHVLLADTVSKKNANLSGRRAVPLAYALLGLSTANMPTVELLNRLSHDGDVPTAMNAVLGMGLVGSGTTNARIATMLRQLAQYYHKDKDSNILFMVRLAQGLVALGKGHVSLSPLMQDNSVLSVSSLAGLLGLFHCALDAQGTLLDRYHHMVYAVTPAIHPRAIIAVDAAVNPIPAGVTVRIGQPVDTVTVAGKPKTITGFQTHTAPVLLSTGDRAEVAPGKFRSFAAVLEGVVVVEEKTFADAA